MTSQVFINEVKGNFNLRRPKSSKPTNIYYVIYLFGKQHYFATGLKIYPDQWDKQRQQAIISNRQTKLDNRNNKLLNDKLKQFNSYLSEYKSYICDNPEDINKGEILLKSYIYKDMKKDKATDIINKAFDYYYNTLHTEVKESSKKVFRQTLNAFIKYATQKGDSIDLLTQQGLNDYKQYLLEERQEKENSGVEIINKKCELITRLINDVLCVNNEYLKYELRIVRYVKLKDTRKQEDKGKFSLEEEEIEEIKKVELDERLNEYRDIFLLQISCGQRVSDLCKLINKEYTEEEKYYIINTIKKDIKAFIEKSEVIDRFFIKYKDGFKFARTNNGNIELDKDGGLYNKAIREICKIANLDREIEFIDTQNNKRKEPLYKKIVNHDARHTFITMKLREGMTPDELKHLSGHADDDVINKIYAHLTSTDKIKKIEKAKERIEKKKNEESNLSNCVEELIRKDERERIRKQLGGKDKETEIMKVYSQIAKGEFKPKPNNIGYIKELLKKGLIKEVKDIKTIGKNKVEYIRYEIV